MDRDGAAMHAGDPRGTRVHDLPGADDATRTPDWQVFCLRYAGSALVTALYDNPLMV